jgi:hypothetical protein
MTSRELERQLRSVHPYRERSRRQRRALARTRQQVRMLVGVILGLGVVALLGAVQLLSEDLPDVAGGQAAAWGRLHTGSFGGDGTGATRGGSLFPERKRSYNPLYDPRSRRAEKVRREMFWN